MPNDYFSFKQFTIRQEKSSFKVGTDGVLLGACADIEGAGSILDIGTGTGLIAIMAAQRSDAEITAIEPEIGSFMQAEINIKNCPWPGRIKLINTDLKKFFETTGQKFDLLISNPPYFRNSLKNQDAVKTLTRHADSLTSTDLLRGSATLLEENGRLEIIMPYTEGTVFIAEASEWGLYCNRIIKVKGNPKGDVIRLIMKFERTKKPVHEKYLTIETGTRHRYTEEYKEATRDFYLKF